MMMEPSILGFHQAHCCLRPDAATRAEEQLPMSMTESKTLVSLTKKTIKFPADVFLFIFSFVPGSQSPCLSLPKTQFF